MKIQSLPLPSGLRDLLTSLGYADLYPPQEEAVRAGALKEGSLLLTTPTASGKTLVAMLAAGRLVLEGEGKVVYLTPLRALANEKHEEFKPFEALKKPDGSRVRVFISTGDYDASGESLGAGDIIILTNEKFDSVIRHGVSWLDSVKLYVADEVHLVGDRHRGPTIETILAKIRSFAPEARVLALSATVNNSRDVAEWLGAKLVDTEWRPVKLVEGVYDYGRIRYADGSERAIDVTNRGAVIDVAVDILREGGQSLVFTETRRRSVSLALKASEVTSRFLSDEERLKAGEAAEEIASTGEETELSRVLVQAVAKGSAFHHAGLDVRHRRIVENTFRGGLIKILAATPTLAAGVNLPARRVVVASYMRYDAVYGGRAPITVLEYKQLAGRAGRPKYDDIGEAILIATSSVDAEDLLQHYVEGTPEPVRSQLADEGALRAHALALIASFPGVSGPEIMDFFSRTLFAKQYRPATVKSRVSRALEYLADEDLVQERGRRLLATDFGRRVSLLYIDPATGVSFRSALKRAEEGRLHTAGLLHLVASAPDFTPRFPLRNQDWDVGLSFLEEHKDEFITPVPRQRHLHFEEFLSDFRTLMTLAAWIDEWHEDRLLKTYGVEPGDIYRAVESADWLLYSLYEISKLLGRSDLLGEIDELRMRVKYGARKELLALTRLEGVGRVRARSLYNAGFTSLDRLAAASVERLASVPKVGGAIAKRIKQQLQARGSG